MNRLRRQFLRLAAGAAVLPALSRVASAQAYPTRPVRMVVGLPAGAGGDILARLVAQWLSERIGQQVVIENRPGAGTSIGTEVVVRAPPDGYTLLYVTSANAISASFYSNLSFNFIRDIAPVACVGRIPLVMAVNASFPAQTVPEFIAYAKANPARINMASGGNGGTLHVAGELFKMMAGVNMTHVPYRGDAPALTDLVSGQVQVMFATMPASIEHAARAGGHHRAPLGRAARHPDRWRIPARL
jgi:tripartite-type tricarboxylate transporter receptor subunit TctC